jgi:hypothetical protein
MINLVLLGVLIERTASELRRRFKPGESRSPVR